jgi:hypothetical protein
VEMNGYFYIKCHCKTCGGKIEFPSYGVNEIIRCPHCEWETVLRDPLELPVFDEEKDRSIRVKSSDQSSSYIVNLFDFTCTCPDFLERRCNVPKRNLLRACKHICRTLGSKSRRKLLSRLQDALISNSIVADIGIYPGCIREDDLGNLVFVSEPTNEGWINIIAPVWKNKISETYDHFGYNIQEKRWSYGLRPGIRNFEEFLASSKDTDHRLRYEPPM